MNEKTAWFPLIRGKRGSLAWCRCASGPADESPMTACGGNFIGDEIRRNEQCPHEADLRRLSLRGTPPTRMQSIRGKPGNHPQGKVYFPPRIFPGFLGPEALKLSVTPARQAELVCFSQLRYFAKCGSRDEARTAACGGCSVRAEIDRNEQCPHQADLRRLRLRTLRTLVGVWGEQPQRLLPHRLCNDPFRIRKTGREITACFLQGKGELTPIR